MRNSREHTTARPTLGNHSTRTSIVPADREPDRQARDLCDLWAEDYTHDAPEDERSRFLGDSCSKGYRQNYATWFELLMHQFLVRLGFSITIHPDLPGRDKHPDFGAASNGPRVLVEATVVAPENDVFAPTNYERDAQEKFTQLEIANFTIGVLRVSGPLKRPLKNREIKREFERLVASHDPDGVQRRIEQYGYGALPTELMRLGDLHLLVELHPLPAGKRAPRKARVASWPQAQTYDDSVPNARKKIRDKLHDYGSTDDPLVLAVNVHNLGGFDTEIDGRGSCSAGTALGTGGVPAPQESYSSRTLTPMPSLPLKPFCL